MNGNKQNENKTDAGANGVSCLKKSAPIRNISHPLRYYEFTPEEIRALEECDKESFYYRCLPFSGALAALTYAGIRTGHLNRNPHFGGAVPKVALAIALGHVCGRLAYITECDKKLRSLPSGSYLGEVMRQHYLVRNQQHTTKDVP